MKIGLWLAILSVAGMVRYGLSHDWPNNSDLPFGSLWARAAVVLFLATAWLACRIAADQARSERTTIARRFLLAACGAGILALVACGQHGLHLRQTNLIFGSGTHGATDLKYHAAVAARLAELRLDSRTTPAQRALVGQLQSDLTEWTSRIIAGNTGSAVYDAMPPDDVFRRGALQALAQAVYSRAANRSDVESYLRREAAVIDAGLTEAQALQQQQLVQQALLAKQLHSLSLSDSARLTEDADALRTRQKSLVAQELTQLEIEQQSTQKTIARLKNRMQLRRTLRDAIGGLNRSYSWLRLPVSLPGGNYWSWTTTALWSALGFDLMLGVLISLCWQARVGANLRQQAEFLCLYWGLASLASLIVCRLT